MSNPIIKSASRLRLVLAICLVAACLAMIAAAWVGLRTIDSYAIDVNQSVQEGDMSDDELSNLQHLSLDYDNHLSAVKRAEQIVAESKSYEYQDRIIADIKTLARKSGITILEYDFSATGKTSTGSTSPTPGTSSQQAVPYTIVGGLKSTKVSISVHNPVSHEALLHFIHGIEQNNTKMQIETVSLHQSSDENAPPGYIDSDSFVIEVYIR